MSDLRERPELRQRPRRLGREVRPPKVIAPRPPRSFRWISWSAVLVGVAVLATAATWMFLRDGGEEPVVVDGPAVFAYQWDPFGTLGQYTPPVNPGHWDPAHTLGQYTPPVQFQVAASDWDPYGTLGQYTPPAQFTQAALDPDGWDPFGTLGQYTPPLNPGAWDPFGTLGQYTPPSYPS